MEPASAYRQALFCRKLRINPVVSKSINKHERRMKDFQCEESTCRFFCGLCKEDRRAGRQWEARKTQQIGFKNPVCSNSFCCPDGHVRDSCGDGWDKTCLFGISRWGSTSSTWWRTRHISCWTLRSPTSGHSAISLLSASCRCYYDMISIYNIQFSMMWSAFPYLFCSSQDPPKFDVTEMLRSSRSSTMTIRRIRPLPRSRMRTANRTTWNASVVSWVEIQ